MFAGSVEALVIPNFDAGTNWQLIFSGVDCVLHLASVVHLAGVPNAIYQKINVELTAMLAAEAKEARVGRFIFLSSIAVNGRGGKDVVFNEKSRPSPESAYAESKLRAEQTLETIASGSAMSWVIIRPPMVYGPDAPGNFMRLVWICRRGLPLPLASATSLRSYIGLDNLVSALLCVASNPVAANRLYLVSDDEDIGTNGLIKLITHAIGRPSRLWWLPQWLLFSIATLIGRKQDADRVLSPLQIDISRIRHELDWKPRISLEKGISRAISVSPDKS